jgi:hypothetical protein
MGSLVGHERAIARRGSALGLRGGDAPASRLCAGLALVGLS